MAVISTGNHPKALWPGVKRWFGMKYAEKPMQCNEVFDIMSSDKAYEEDVEATSFGLAPVKAEGASLTYDDHNQGGTATYTHVTYGLGYKVTMEELDDNKYAEVSRGRAAALAFSMRQTKEVVAANILNRGFTSAYAGYDGVELFSTAHPTRDGNQSNELAVAADMSEASIEDLLIQVRNAENSRGLKINLSGQKLIVPVALMFEAQRIVRSTLQAGTANNDVNALRSMGMFPGGIMVYDYLTDDDAWFIKTDAPTGLTGYQRKKMVFDQDNDFDTKNACASAIERYSFGWSDWRGVYGSPGA